MKQVEMLTISKFAELSGVTRSNLLYYDEIDILKPAFRGENNYRLYSYKQLELLFVIVSLRDIGLPLKVIRDFMQNRTPEKALRLFEDQIETVEKEIGKLQQLRDFLGRYVKTIRLHKDLPTPLMTLELRKAEPIHLGPKIDRARGDFIAYDDFIGQCNAAGINFVNHMGQIFSKENALDGDCDTADCFYVKIENGEDKIEEGLYATVYLRDLAYDDIGFIWDNRAIVGELLKYTHDNYLDICGDIYMECPIDEMSASDGKDCLVKIFARVRKK